MTEPQKSPGENSIDTNASAQEQVNQTSTEDRYERGTAIDVFASKEEAFPEKHNNNDVATNDGSVLESLDTAFHDKPGYTDDNSVSGSNRDDYYEERSSGKSDDEEELEILGDNPANI
jgi:hypothetical protein